MAIRLSDHYRRKFGCKVYKLSIDAGFTCPNRDGTLGTGGCIFCDGSGAFAGRGDSVAQQLEKARERVSFKGGERFIAYFQAFTNTYGPLPYLEKCYREALAPEDVVGLSLGTRPDCLEPPVVQLLARLNREKPVSVELGLQTVKPESVRYIRRGYENDVYFDAVKRLKEAGLDVVTHIILGLPGETREDFCRTTQAAIDAGSDGVKFHLLHVLRGTALAEAYERGEFRCMELEEYADALEACIALLPARMVVHRITGDGAKRDLIAPLWSGDKKRVLQYLNTRLDPYFVRK